MNNNRDNYIDRNQILRCAIYVRKSHEEGLEQEFNSLDAQRESAESYIESQRIRGWVALPDRYDDGGFSGGNMERPALKRLLSDIEDGKIDIIVTYKIDRLSRSLLDFMKMIEFFNEKGVSFVSVTQDFRTTDPTGRMMLGILITFAQYEREIIGERIRDKVAAAKRRGKYCGGVPVLGYDLTDEKKLVINQDEADIVKFIFKRYQQVASAKQVSRELNERGYSTKSLITKKGKERSGKEWGRHDVYRILNNRLYVGETKHKDAYYKGEHAPIIHNDIWDSCRKLLLENTLEKKQKAQVTNISSLSGVLRCGHCDSPMTVSYSSKNNRWYAYYICSKDVMRTESTCPVRRIQAGVIEQEVLNQLSAVFRTPTLVANTYFAAKDLEKDEKKRLMTQKEFLKESLQEIRNDALEIVSSEGDDKKEKLEDLNRKSLTLQRELDYVKTKLRVIEKGSIMEKNVSDAFLTVETFWHYLFPPERNRLIQLLVEKIEIRETGIDMFLKTNGMTNLITELTVLAGEAEERSA